MLTVLICVQKNSMKLSLIIQYYSTYIIKLLSLVNIIIPIYRSDDPFDTVMSVVPQSKTEKTLKDLSKEGYDDGPEPSPV